MAGDTSPNQPQDAGATDDWQEVSAQLFETLATNPECPIVVEKPPPKLPPVPPTLLDIEYRRREVCLEHFNGRYYLAIRYEGTLLRYHLDQKAPEGKGAEVPGTRQPTSGFFFQGPAVPQLRDLCDIILTALARHNTPIAADLFFCRDPETEAELRALLALLAGARISGPGCPGCPDWPSGPGCPGCPDWLSGEDLAARITSGPPSWPQAIPNPNPDAWPWCEPTEEELRDNPGLRKMWAGLLQPGYSQREWLASLPPLDQRAPKAAPTRARARRGPTKIPQPTFPEIAAQMRALADGPSGRNFEELQAEEALLHRTPGHQVTTKIVPGPLLDWFHKPATTKALREELREAGLPAAFQLAVIVGWGLKDRGSLIRRPLDDIAMTVKGRPAKSRAERLAWRQEVWRYLLLGESLSNPARRPGRFVDEDGEVIETIARDGLYRVFGEEWPDQPALDGSTPPVTVTIGLHPEIEKLVNREDVLTFFGDVLMLAPIPDGQTSGRWARAMGLSLNQLFRQRQRLARVKYQGEDNLPAIPFTFTRKDVLVYVAADVEAILAGNDPSRAREYWEAAIDLLLPPKSAGDKRAGVLATRPRELTPLPGGRRTWKEWRQGWQTFWYEQQRLEFRPGPDGVKALLAMKQSSQRKRKKGVK